MSRFNNGEIYGRSQPKNGLIRQLGKFAMKGELAR